jgi:hypothetical protein
LLELAQHFPACNTCSLDATAELSLEQLDPQLCRDGALSHVHAVYHPVLFIRSLNTDKDDLEYPPPNPDPPFSFILCIGEIYPRNLIVGCSVPGLIPANILVSLYDWLTHVAAHGARSYFKIKTAFAGVACPAQLRADRRPLGVFPPKLAKRETAGAWHFVIVLAKLFIEEGLSTRNGDDKGMHWGFVRRKHAGRSDTEHPETLESEVFDVYGWLDALEPQASAVDKVWVDKLAEQLRNTTELSLLTPA